MPTSSLAAIGRLLKSDHLKGMAAAVGAQAPISALEVRRLASERVFLGAWQLATQSGIAKDEQGAVWHTGRVTDVLPLDQERVLLAGASSGVWLADVQNASTQPVPLSLSWPLVDLRCLGTGPRGPRHVYAAGDGAALLETETQSLASVGRFLGTASTKKMAAKLGFDPTRPISVSDILRASDAPLHDWRPIPFVDPLGKSILDQQGFVPVINRLACVSDAHPAKLVLATSVGVYWSDVPGAGQAYGFRQASGTPPAVTCWDVVAVPIGNVVASPSGFGSTPTQKGIYWGNWKAGELKMERAIFFGDIDVTHWGQEAVVASCAADQSVLYAAVSDSGGGPRSLKRAFKGWDLVNPPLSTKQLATKPPLAAPISVKELVTSNWAVYAVLESQNGGGVWLPAGPDQSVDGSIEFQRSAGLYQDSTLCIAVSNTDTNTIALGTRTGPLIGRNRPDGLKWEDHGDHNAPGHAASLHLHGDLRSVQFDDTDPGGNTLYVCCDGGLVFTKDLGQSFVSRVNQLLPNLQFQGYPSYADGGNGASGASFDRSGLLGGALQDNGVVFSFQREGRQVAWQQMVDGDGQPVGGDGLLAVFLKGDLFLFWNNDSPAAQVAKWNGAGFDSSVKVLVRTPGAGLAAGRTLDNRFAEPILTPAFRRSDTNQLMLAVAAYNPGVPRRDVWGLFADDDGSNPSWDFLAELPGNDLDQDEHITAAASHDGSSVMVGTSSGNIFSVDTESGSTRKIALDAGIQALAQLLSEADIPVGAESGSTHDLHSVLPGATGPGSVYQFAFVNGSAIARYRKVLASLQAGGDKWTAVNGNGLPLQDDQLQFMAVDTTKAPNHLYVATRKTVHVSWDEGANWLPVSLGLPARAHSSTLGFVQDPSGAELYLFTYGWSAFRATVL
jgi:hypothetical protein